jgi:hypothetical protein
VGKPEGKRPLGRWKDNIKIGLQELRLGGQGQDLVRDKERWRVLVNVAMNLLVP